MASGTQNLTSYKARYLAGGIAEVQQHLNVTGTTYFSVGTSVTDGKPILAYNSANANFGLRYFESSPDVLTISASGNNNSKTGADFSINGLGDGILSHLGNYIPHTGNTTGTVGDDSRPVYVNAGTITQVNTPNSGAWFTGVPQVRSDGVMEIGKYIDWHHEDTTTKDYSVRMTAGDGTLTISGTTYGTFNGSLTGNATTASALVPYASIGSSTTDHGVALKNWFTANKSTAPRSQVISFHSSTSNNGSQYMGYFLSGYADNPYGGFFVCHYNNPYYVGIQNGTYTQQHILTSTNYASYAVTLSTDQTITGTKTFQKRIIAHGYKQATNLPFMTFDKPGSYATGMGPDGTSNRIKFGPCDLAGTAWTAQSSFNSNQWFFQGSIYGTSTLTIESSATINGGITSQHGHIFNTSGNEFNWIPDKYNSTMWLNYESFNRANNSTISEYICGNGKHGHANLRAAKVYNAVWNDFAEYREGTTTEAGRVVAATADSNKVSLTYERLQPCAHVISDTFGCSVGQSDTAQTPIGVGGRVLVYPYQSIENYHVGDCLCAAPNGTADIMTREEIIQYPDRIIGVVDEIPSYLIWKQTLTTDKEKNGGGKVETSVPVNGRIWIYVR